MVRLTVDLVDVPLDLGLREELLVHVSLCVRVLHQLHNIHTSTPSRHWRRVLRASTQESYATNCNLM